MHQCMYDEIFFIILGSSARYVRLITLIRDKLFSRKKKRLGNLFWKQNKLLYLFNFIAILSPALEIYFNYRLIGAALLSP